MKFVVTKHLRARGLHVRSSGTFLVGLKDGKFSIISPKKLEKQNSDSIIKILNGAWALFWDNPEEFRDWEERCIEKLKSMI